MAPHPRVAGTVFSDGRPRLIQIKDIGLDAEFAPHMLYVVNEDKPGFIGKLGTLLGDAKVNIANFTVGRSAPGKDAITLIEVDGPVPEEVAAEVEKLPLVKPRPLAFKRPSSPLGEEENRGVGATATLLQFQ
jgi:D-3-phosphoglycerate dehydrogenase